MDICYDKSSLQPINFPLTDTTRPEIHGCPNNIHATIELGTAEKSIRWTEPTATDLFGTPTRTRSHQPGEEFPVGVTSVRYTFTDESNNIATCEFSVSLESGISRFLFYQIIPGR